MNMSYGYPKWMIDALWRQRKVIFFAISAASIVGNAVVLVDSLGTHKAFMSLLSRLLLQLRDAGEVLVQRPVLYMLLNLIMLRMVVKSGMLGGRAAKPVHEAEIDRRGETTVYTYENFDDQHPAQEQAFVPSVSMKRHAGAVMFSYAEPALDSNVSFERGVAGEPASRAAAAARQPKQASLFTIEPLDSSSIEPPSTVSAAHNMGGDQIMSTAQLSIDTASPNTHAGQFTKEPQIGSTPVPHDNSHDRVYPIPHKNSAFNRPNDSVRLDDYDLNKQEFNERVETFITKFKRNLTMQRQDSFNRLLELVGVGVKKS